MRTIGHKIRDKASQGGFPALCACGIPWPRNKLRRSADGQLRCPLERGRDAVELDRAIQRNSISREEINHWGGQGELGGSTFPDDSVDDSVFLEAMEFTKELRGAAILDGLRVRACLVADIGITEDDDGKVSSWADPAIGISFSQATAAQQPLRSQSDGAMGGRASITGDGSNDRLDCSSYAVPALAASAYYVLMVGYQITSTSADALIGHSGNQSGAVFQDASAPGLSIGTIVNPTGASLGSAVAIEVGCSATAPFLRAGSVEVGNGSIAPTSAGSGSRTLFGHIFSASNISLGLFFETLGLPTDTFRQRARALVRGYYPGVLT